MQRRWDELEVFGVLFILVVGLQGEKCTHSAVKNSTSLILDDE